MIEIILSISIPLGLLLIFFILVVTIGRHFFHITFDRRNNDFTFAKDEKQQDKQIPSRLWFSKQHLEEITIKSFDGLWLKGYLLDNNSDKLAILVHGYRGRYYSSTTIAKILYEIGYSVLLINNRAHDTSEGKTFTMGSKERKDLLQWISLMISRNKDYKIVLFGSSMGAHIAMVTAANKEIPSNVKCLIEDCGYASLRKELRYQCYKVSKSKLSNVIVFFGEIYAILFHHFTFNSNTKKACKTMKIPTLFIHGDKDSFVPYENLKLNSDAMSKSIYKEVVTFEGADHSCSNRQEEKYSSTVVNFVNRYIK